MSLLDHSELKKLLVQAVPPCVSIYVPTFRAGIDAFQNPIQVKTALAEAEKNLEEAGNKRTETDRILTPARRLLDDGRFWRYQSEGLALFLSGGDMSMYRLPIQVEKLVTVAGRYHLKPLLPLLTGDGRFHILALSQKNVRLFEASRENIREVDQHAIPRSLGEVVGYDWEQKSLQFHSGGSGGRTPIYHGSMASEVSDDREIARFLTVVDSGVRKLLVHQRTPLVVAAVEREIGLYRSTSKYKELMGTGIEGSPENMSVGELHEKAWQIVEPRFSAERDRAVTRFGDLSDTDQTSGSLRTVIQAADRGRVDTAFVALDEHVWGKFDSETGRIEVYDEKPRTNAEDLLDTIALQTLLHGGTVYAIDRKRIPNGAKVGAIFRF
jgi:hypothetical protein